jgi:hypothetical protein
MSADTVIVSRNETAAERWARWHATCDPNRPKRTVRQARRYAQKNSAAVQAERRRLAAHASLAQIARDRELVRRGLRFVAAYTPPHVTPAGAVTVSPGQFQQSTPALFVNVAALQAVTYILGGAPLWVRRIELAWDAPRDHRVPPVSAWDAAEWFTVAIRVERHDMFGGGAFFRGTRYYLKPLDLLSHRDREPLTDLPAATVPWASVLAEDAAYVTGLPTLNLKKFVRWAIGGWVQLDRKYEIPWATWSSGPNAV